MARATGGTEWIPAALRAVGGRLAREHQALVKSMMTIVCGLPESSNSHSRLLSADSRIRQRASAGVRRWLVDEQQQGVRHRILGHRLSNC
jgi:hypothetical protein